MRFVIGLSFLFLAFAATPASAQGTARQRSACTDDAYRFCENFVPNQIAVEQCLRGHIGELSRACRNEFTGGAKPKKRKRAR
jgi:hypothetical protein